MSSKSVQQECLAKSVQQECQARMSRKSVPQDWQARVSSKECPARVSSKSVQQECPSKSVKQKCQARGSSKSDQQECPARVSRKSVKKECPARVSSKSVKKECQARVSRKSVKQEFEECPARRCCSLVTVRVISTKKREVFSFLRSFLCTLLYIKWLHSGSWVLSGFWPQGTLESKKEGFRVKKRSLKQPNRRKLSFPNRCLGGWNTKHHRPKTIKCTVETIKNIQTKRRWRGIGFASMIEVYKLFSRHWFCFLIYMFFIFGLPVLQAF